MEDQLRFMEPRGFQWATCVSKAAGPIRAKWSRAAAEGLQIVAECPASAWEGTWGS